MICKISPAYNIGKMKSMLSTWTPPPELKRQEAAERSFLERVQVHIYVDPDTAHIASGNCGDLFSAQVGQHQVAIKAVENNAAVEREVLFFRQQSSAKNAPRRPQLITFLGVGDNTVMDEVAYPRIKPCSIVMPLMGHNYEQYVLSLDPKEREVALAVGFHDMLLAAKDSATDPSDEREFIQNRDIKNPNNYMVHHGRLIGIDSSLCIRNTFDPSGPMLDIYLKNCVSDCVIAAIRPFVSPKANSSDVAADLFHFKPKAVIESGVPESMFRTLKRAFESNSIDAAIKIAQDHVEKLRGPLGDLPPLLDAVEFWNDIYRVAKKWARTNLTVGTPFAFIPDPEFLHEQNLQHGERCHLTVTLMDSFDRPVLRDAPIAAFVKLPSGHLFCAKCEGADGGKILISFLASETGKHTITMSLQNPTRRLFVTPERDSIDLMIQVEPPAPNADLDKENLPHGINSLEGGPLRHAAGPVPRKPVSPVPGIFFPHGHLNSRPWIRDRLNELSKNQQLLRLGLVAARLYRATVDEFAYTGDAPQLDVSFIPSQTPVHVRLPLKSRLRPLYDTMYTALYHPQRTQEVRNIAEILEFHNKIGRIKDRRPSAKGKDPSKPIPPAEFLLRLMVILLWCCNVRVSEAFSLDIDYTDPTGTLHFVCAKTEPNKGVKLPFVSRDNIPAPDKRHQKGPYPSLALVAVCENLRLWIECLSSASESTTAV